MAKASPRRTIKPALESRPRSAPIEPVFFETPAAFRQWLRKHHQTAADVWVGYYKKASGHRSISYPESLDEALCFGWIDGIRKSIDGERYMNRFTPRRPGSNWSLVNVRKVKALIAAGRMQPAGLAAYEARDANKTGVYSSENRPLSLTPELEAMFRKQAAAWRFWEAQPPGYRRMMVWFVMSAKRDDTRERRLERLIAECAAGRRIEPMKPSRDSAP
jgi:uncharacterized protein YdeI (YjbR/CyaY-like superfamily)